MSIRIFFLALHHISKLNVLNYVSVFRINNLLFLHHIFYFYISVSHSGKHQMLLLENILPESPKTCSHLAGIFCLLYKRKDFKLFHN